eukprot:c34949_g1_i1 orf=1-180(-)
MKSTPVLAVVLKEMIVSVASVSIGQSVSVEDRYAQPKNFSKCPDGICCNETSKGNSGSFN